MYGSVVCYGAINLTSISCHFRECKALALQVTSPTVVNSSAASVRTFTFLVYSIALCNSWSSLVNIDIDNLFVHRIQCIHALGLSGGKQLSAFEYHRQFQLH